MVKSSVSRGPWVAWYLLQRRRKRLAAAAPPVPAAPSNLFANDNVTDVLLTWSDNSSNENGFRVYRNAAMVAQLAAGTTSWDDTNVVVQAHYDYYVVAYNAFGESTPSNTFSVTIGT